MIDIKLASKIAIDYFTEFIKLNSDDTTIFNVLLEEIYKDSYKVLEDCWYITIGFDEVKKNQNVWANIVGSVPPKRRYKTVIIDQEGKVLALKIRESEYA